MALPFAATAEHGMLRWLVPLSVAAHAAVFAIAPSHVAPFFFARATAADRDSGGIAAAASSGSAARSDSARYASGQRFFAACAFRTHRARAVGAGSFDRHELGRPGRFHEHGDVERYGEWAAQ